MWLCRRRPHLVIAVKLAANTGRAAAANCASPSVDSVSVCVLFMEFVLMEQTVPTPEPGTGTWAWTRPGILKYKMWCHAHTHTHIRVIYTWYINKLFLFQNNNNNSISRSLKVKHCKHRHTAPGFSLLHTNRRPVNQVWSTAQQCRSLSRSQKV